MRSPPAPPADAWLPQDKGLCESGTEANTDTKNEQVAHPNLQLHFGDEDVPQFHDSVCAGSCLHALQRGRTAWCLLGSDATTTPQKANCAPFFACAQENADSQRSAGSKTDFKAAPCSRFMRGRCHAGSNCKYAHSAAELRPLPPDEAWPLPLGLKGNKESGHNIGSSQRTGARSGRHDAAKRDGPHCFHQQQQRKCQAAAQRLGCVGGNPPPGSSSSSGSKGSGGSTTSVSSTPSSNSSIGCSSNASSAATELAYTRMRQQLLRDCEALLSCMGLAPAAGGRGAPPVIDVRRTPGPQEGGGPPLPLNPPSQSRGGALAPPCTSPSSSHLAVSAQHQLLLQQHLLQQQQKQRHEITQRQELQQQQQQQQPEIDLAIQGLLAQLAVLSLPSAAGQQQQQPRQQQQQLLQQQVQQEQQKVLQEQLQQQQVLLQIQQDYPFLANAFPLGALGGPPGFASPRGPPLYTLGGGPAKEVFLGSPLLEQGTPSLVHHASVTPEAPVGDWKSSSNSNNNSNGSSSGSCCCCSGAPVPGSALSASSALAFPSSSQKEAPEAPIPSWFCFR
ncbi:histone-lysine N-methyltransferase 2D [Cyclospora cayetanensis]|uniref:Histone-lysine N-methyltransferase 2D n=1 Tax=Cyclospora cayetanensis TaxID=88456 RepID=A0A6P6S2F5_9EIME|nr:histone-lysine N-methyltransferase 2D [Cyclospora cayetanensis]